MQLTRKVRIYPSKEQEDTLSVLSDRCRLIYNFALAERKERYATEGKGISYIDQQNRLPEIKEQYPEYKQVNSKVLQMVLRTFRRELQIVLCINKRTKSGCKTTGF